MPEKIVNNAVKTLDQSGPVQGAAGSSSQESILISISCGPVVSQDYYITVYLDCP